MFSFLLHHCSWISSRVASSFLCSVSSESQSDHRATSLVCFRCVTLCHQICFVLLCADVCKICQLLLHNILHIHVLQHHNVSFFQVLSWMPMLLQTDCRHGSRETPSLPSLSRGVSSPSLRQFQSSGRIILLQQNSNLLFADVLDHAVSVAFPHCTTPPLVLLHVVACPAQSLSVYTFTNFDGVMISIKLFPLGAPFKYLSMRFRFISSLSVEHVIFLAVSLTLYMMSCSFPGTCTTVFPQLFCTLLVFSPSQLNERFCRWRPLHTWSHHWFCFLQTKNIHHILDVLRIRFHTNILVPFAQSLCPGNKFCHLSSPFFL